MASLDLPTTEPAKKDNRRLAAMLLLLTCAMLGMAYAAVPLYYAFCAATGYGGTTRVAEAAPKGVIARQMTTRFDATISSGLAIRVKAAKPVTDAIGAARTIDFVATNPTARTITTTAGFNVTPELAGQYFNKIECFCFTKQTLKPGETIDMPVTFFIDPELDKNSDLDTVQDITLSYTFYASDNGGS